MEVADDYTKRKNVFRIKTDSGSEYLFQVMMTARHAARDNAFCDAIPRAHLYATLVTHDALSRCRRPARQR